MSKEVVKVVSGKHHRFEIVRETDVFSTKFFIREDEEHFAGPYASVEDAVAAAEQKKDAGLVA